MTGFEHSRLIVLRKAAQNRCYSFAQKRRLPAITAQNPTSDTNWKQKTVSHHRSLSVLYLDSTAKNSHSKTSAFSLSMHTATFFRKLISTVVVVAGSSFL